MRSGRLFVLVVLAGCSKPPDNDGASPRTSTDAHPAPPVPVAADASPQPEPLFHKQRVTYRSGDLTLVGYSYQPEGPGPFPTVVWNHGSEKDPAGGPQFDAVAKVFVPAGYAVFAPTRRGHSESQGSYIGDRLARLRQQGDEDGAGRLMVELLETEQFADLRAGVDHATGLAFVDESRLVVAGCSFGGIETLLAAETDPRFRAALSLSPAALTWDRTPPIRKRLIAAAEKTSIPVLLLQPPKDAPRAVARPRRGGPAGRPDHVRHQGVCRDDGRGGARALLWRPPGLSQLGRRSDRLLRSGARASRVPLTIRGRAPESGSDRYRRKSFTLTIL